MKRERKRETKHNKLNSINKFYIYKNKITVNDKVSFKNKLLGATMGDSNEELYITEERGNA